MALPLGAVNPMTPQMADKLRELIKLCDDCLPACQSMEECGIAFQDITKGFIDNRDDMLKMLNAFGYGV